MAKKTNNLPTATNTDFYILTISSCDRYGQAQEIRDRAMKKVEDVDCARVQLQELTYVAGFTYELPSGTVNPINPDDADWEDKVLVHKPSRDKQGRICLKAAYYVAKPQVHALWVLDKHVRI
ncbi:hypothetical protein LTR56_003058 [Elasticomyces elasticus]|nr:hypothetical protein LTR56_003058 [Elasticomyces elasticus]KAK3662120.1 hypothetical protein LTR22_007093 [Elasticomyces elasticus]KAK4927517.1 hypothetical protein LTR49_005657 [Elasticomyces elasticus]KAK5749771.1 hypothetical protein LTS12_020199 [Elasticomyces elasticus]